MIILENMPNNHHLCTNTVHCVAFNKHPFCLTTKTFKTMKKHLLCILMLLTAALTASGEVFYNEDGTFWGFDDEHFLYVVHGNEVTVSYLGDLYTGVHPDAIEIPATVSCNGLTFTVTTIANSAFYDSYLRSVTIPNTVSTIEYEAFLNCPNLTNIDIPNSVKHIGRNAFTGTAWYNNQPDGLVYAGQVAYQYKGNMPSGTSITLKEGTLAIADNAFYDCNELTNLTIPNSVTHIGDNACFSCRYLKNVTIPNSVIYIGNYAFYECTSLELEYLAIPSSATYIGYFSFYGCHLKSLAIGSSVSEICSGAFAQCYSLTSITVDSNNLYYDSRDNCNAIIETSSNTLIAGCKNTIIPNSVTAIGNMAFHGMHHMTSLTIPNSVTHIGNGAISTCLGLTSLVIPNSVTFIDVNAFRGNDNMRSVTIGNSVTSIGFHAFDYCRSLRNVTCLANTPPILNKSTAGDPFYFLTFEYGTLYVPNASIADYKNADQWKRFVNIRGIGDLDGDGELNVNDVANLIDEILAGRVNYEDNPAADLNGDGNIDITDIVDIIDQLLNSSN